MVRGRLVAFPSPQTNGVMPRGGSAEPDCRLADAVPEGSMASVDYNKALVNFGGERVFCFACPARARGGWLGSRIWW